jgi:hypothetical protein
LAILLFDADEVAKYTVDVRVAQHFRHQYRQPTADWLTTEVLREWPLQVFHFLIKVGLPTTLSMQRRGAFAALKNALMTVIDGSFAHTG